MLNFDEIATFLAVASCGNFTAAATQLHVTQSTISHQIKRLEDRIGQQLFIRTTRSVKLTMAGERFLPYCSKLLELVKEAEQSVSVEHITGEVRLGVPEEFAHEQLSELLARFRLRYPSISLYVEVGLGDILTDRFSSGLLDLMLIKQAPASDECIRDEPLVWAGREILLDTDPIPLAFLPSPCTFRAVAIAAMEESDRDYSVILVSSNLEALRRSAMTGLAITVLPKSLCPIELVINTRSNKLPPLPCMGYLLKAKSHPDKPTMIAAEIVHDLLVE